EGVPGAHGRTVLLGVRTHGEREWKLGVAEAEPERVTLRPAWVGRELEAGGGLDRVHRAYATVGDDVGVGTRPAVLEHLPRELQLPARPPAQGGAEREGKVHALLGGEGILLDAHVAVGPRQQAKREGAGQLA